MPLLQVTNHEASSSSPQRLEPLMPVLKNSASMPFSGSDFTMDRKTCHMMATDNRATPHYLWNQTTKKTWVRMTESHPIQQSPGNTRRVEFAGRAFRNSTLWPNQQEHTPNIYSSSSERNLRTTTFIQPADQLWLRSRPPPQLCECGTILLGHLPRRTALQQCSRGISC
jgi:hypothetical protein